MPGGPRSSNVAASRLQTLAHGLSRYTKSIFHDYAKSQLKDRFLCTDEVVISQLRARRPVSGLFQV